MTIIIHLLLFEIFDKIFIKSITHFSNNCKIMLIICLNVFFSIEFSKLNCLTVQTIFDKIFNILILRMLSIFNFNNV